MSGYPPFGAQIILNGHEYVACQARRAGIAFTKTDNCFTAVTDLVGLAQIADALSQHAAGGVWAKSATGGSIPPVCVSPWATNEQLRSGFGYAYSIFQVEYSRNLLFRVGAQMQQLFDRVVDRTRSRLDVPAVCTIFGAKARPHHDRAGSSAIEAVIETPRYDLTGTVAWRQRTSSPCPKAGGTAPQRCPRTVTNRTSKGLQPGLDASRWTSSSKPIA